MTVSRAPPLIRAVYLTAWPGHTVEAGACGGLISCLTWSQCFSLSRSPPCFLVLGLPHQQWLLGPRNCHMPQGEVVSPPLTRPPQSSATCIELSTYPSCIPLLPDTVFCSCLGFENLETHFSFLFFSLFLHLFIYFSWERVRDLQKGADTVWSSASPPSSRSKVCLVCSRQLGIGTPRPPSTSTGHTAMAGPVSAFLTHTIRCIIYCSY